MKKTLMPRQNFILGLLLAILTCLMLNYCGKFDGYVPGTPTVESVTKSLRPDEKHKAVIKGNRLVSVRRNKDGTTSGTARYVPPEGSTEVTVKEDGEVVVSVRDKGVTFSPGVGIGSFGGDLAPVIDVKFVYWGRLGLTAGTGLTRGTVFRPYGAVSLQAVKNTSVFVGYSTHKDVVFGVRLSF